MAQKCICVSFLHHFYHPVYHFYNPAYHFYPVYHVKMANGTILTFQEQMHNQIIFWLSFMPICLNSFVLFAIFRPTLPVTRNLQSPSFQILGFFMLSCLFFCVIWLTIPCGLWGFGHGVISPKVQKIIGTACATFGWYQALLYLAILAAIQLIAALRPVWWFAFSQNPNVKKRCIIFGITCFIFYAIIFGTSYTFDCEFLPNADLVLILKCGYWLRFATSYQTLLLLVSASCSITAIL